MNRRNSVCTIFHAMCLLVMGMLPVSTFADNPMVSREVKHDVSPPLRNLTPGQASTATDQQQLVARPTRPALANAQPDPVAQQLTVPLSGVSTGPNFDGQSANDNRNLLGFAFVPPDTNGAVGATQFVQIVNVTYAVYDKKTSALVLGPALIHTVWTGFGGPCEEAGDGGDPVTARLRAISNALPSPPRRTLLAVTTGTYSILELTSPTIPSSEFGRTRITTRRTHSARGASWERKPALLTAPPCWPAVRRA